MGNNLSLEITDSDNEERAAAVENAEITTATAEVDPGEDSSNISNNSNNSNSKKSKKSGQKRRSSTCKTCSSNISKSKTKSNKKRVY
jgi:hypothetical protein